MLHAQLVVLAESERVEGYLRDVSHYGHSEQEREQAGKVELRHKKEHSGSRDDAQLRRHAAAMDADRLHEYQRCRGEKHGLIGGDYQRHRGKQLRVQLVVQSKTAGEIGGGQHKAGNGQAHAHRAEFLPFVGKRHAKHQQYHAHRQDDRAGKQGNGISGDKVGHYALTYFNVDVRNNNTKNLRNNGRMRVKFDKWLVHIPFLCYLTILLISAEGAVYGGY